MIKDFFAKIKLIWGRYDSIIILYLTIIISTYGFLLAVPNSQLLADYDAIARLNIARKVFDSITPGIGQLGGIWLPFPQVLMIPFVGNDFLWHSGIAGAIVSMIAYIFGGFFLYKTAALVTHNKFASVLAWIIYVANINLLLLQASPMSEAFFLSGLIMVLYFLTNWVVTKKIMSLLFAGLFVTLVTLTRYEGYAVFISSIITVLIGGYAIYGKHKKRRIESATIMFVTLASLGILLWLLYSQLIYGDFLYWLHLYSGQSDLIPSNQSQLETTSTSLLEIKNKTRNLSESFIAYGWAAALMTGIPIAIVGVLGYFSFLYSNVRAALQKKYYLRYIPLLVITLFIFSFLGFAYWKGLIPAIETPPRLLSTLFDKSLNLGSSSNIRYGLIVLPFMGIFAGFLASRNKIFSLLVVLAIFIQIYTYFYTPYFLTFQLPKKWVYATIEPASWLQQNYDGGLILISAHRHEPLMFQTGLPYKTFIYEGSQKYWLQSLKKPSRYATYVVYNTDLKGDSLNEFLENPKQLDKDYTMVHKKGSLLIYKIKDISSIQPITK